MPAAGLQPEADPGGGVPAALAHHGAAPAQVPLSNQKVFHVQKRQMMQPATRVPYNCQAQTKR